MKNPILVTVLLTMITSAAAARGGQQTWILVCPTSLPKSDCNLTTAAKWYHLPSPQASAATPQIKAARAQVGATLDNGFYVSMEQFPAGVSMGERGRIFKACDPQGVAPSDLQEAAWAERGQCLR